MNLYLQEVTEDRKKDIIEYILEMYKYNSKINGVGKLKDYINNDNNDFNGWIRSIKDNEVEGFPLRKELLCVRKEDNKIIGMVNIRKNIDLKNYEFGHVGYSIRPTERNKGYGKAQLHLALIELKKLGIEKCIVTARIDNVISQKIIISLGGILYQTKNTSKGIENYYCIKTSDIIGNNIDFKDESVKIL